MNERVSLTLAESIVNVVEEFCQMNRNHKDRVIAMLSTHIDWSNSFEYRFQGNLGFGGKLCVERSLQSPSGFLARVSCYPEDKTEGRRICIENANKKIREHLNG